MSEQFNLFKSIAWVDSKRIVSDPFLIFMYLSPWGVALCARFGMHYADLHTNDVDLFNYKVLVSVAVALLTPLNMGIVLGFQLLEEKEQGMIKAIAVTPLQHTGYLYYRFALIMAISIFLTLLIHEVLGLVNVPLPYFVLLLLVASLQVPFQALLISTYANNIIEGFAIMKGTGFTLLAPLLVLHFFPYNPLSWLAGIFPFFWVVKAYQMLVADNIMLFFVLLNVGALLAVGLSHQLLKRYIYRVL